MSEETKKNKVASIRGRAYEIDTGVWSYFFIVSDTGMREETIHAHEDDCWKTKDDAIKAMQEHINHGLKAIPEIEVVDRNIGEILKNATDLQ